MIELEQVSEVEKTAKKIESQTETEALDQIIGVYCNLRMKLDPKISELKIETKDLDFVEKELLSLIDTLAPAGEEGTIQTDKFLLHFSKKGDTFKVSDKKKLIEFLGIDQFLEIAEVSVTNIRKYLTKDQVEAIGKDIPTTKRKITYAEKTGA